VNKLTKAKSILQESESNYSNVLQYPTYVDSIDYIINFKAGSAEMLLLSRSFDSPKAGSVIKYLCYMTKKHGHNPLGFAWPVFTSARVDGKSIAKALDIKSRNTMYKTLKDVRIEYKFLRGEGKVDCSSINYKGKYFASYYHATEHKVYWFPNYTKIGDLANRIADEVADLREKSTPAKTSIKTLKNIPTKTSGGTSIESSYDTSTDTSYCKDVGIGIDVEVVVDVREGNKFPTVTDSFAAPNNLTGLIEAEENTVNDENTIIPLRSIKTLFDVWARAAEVTHGEKGLSPKQEDHNQTKNLRVAFAKEQVSFTLEQMVEATVTDWRNLKSYLQNYSDGWKIKNQKFITIPQIQTWYSQVLTWYSQELKNRQEAQTRRIEDQKAAVVKAAYLKANPPPKQSPCTAGYTYFSGKKLTHGGLRVDKTREEDIADFVNNGGSDADILYAKSLLKTNKYLVDYDASLQMIDKLVSEGFRFKNT
jgi:hypothetical protein